MFPVLQNNAIYDILRQRNFWDPRLPQAKLRQADRYMAASMVTDGMVSKKCFRHTHTHTHNTRAHTYTIIYFVMHACKIVHIRTCTYRYLYSSSSSCLLQRSGGSRSEYPSFVQTQYMRTVEARGINQPPDSVPQYPSSGGHARPPQPPQQLRPHFVSQSQQPLSGQDPRYTMASRDQYSHLARDRLSLSLGMPPQHPSASLAQSHPQTAPHHTDGTPPLPFGRTAHFVQTPEMSGLSSGHPSYSRSGAVSPGTPGRFVAEREQSGSGPSYEAYSRNPYHRQ